MRHIAEPAHPTLSPDTALTDALARQAAEHPERPLPEAYRHPGTDKRLTALRTWSERLAMKPSQVVLALLNAQQPTITPIVGVSSIAQLTDAIEATRFSLPQEAVEELNAAG